MCPRSIPDALHRRVAATSTPSVTDPRCPVWSGRGPRRGIPDHPLRHRGGGLVALRRLPPSAGHVPRHPERALGAERMSSTARACTPRHQRDRRTPVVPLVPTSDATGTCARSAARTATSRITHRLIARYAIPALAAATRTASSRSGQPRTASVATAAASSNTPAAPAPSTTRPRTASRSSAGPARRTNGPRPTSAGRHPQRQRRKHQQQLGYPDHGCISVSAAAIAFSTARALFAASVYS